jgi:hypothetical protein
MQDMNETTQIEDFLSLTGPAIIGQVKMILQSAGLKIVEKGCGPDLTFSIKRGSKKIEFCPHNLLIDIATIDRNEESLKFDKELCDFNYFVTKKARFIESRLKVVFQFLTEDNLDVAVDNIYRNTKDYERIHIWRFDRNKPTDIGGSDDPMNEDM